MIATLLEATEMIGLPILLVSGFMLIVLLALLMIILRKDKTYEEIVREREMKLGDFGEEKTAKVVKKKPAHNKPKKPDTNQVQSSVPEITTSEEEISPPAEKMNSPPSPKPPAKQKKTKKQITETASLPPDLEEASITSVTEQQMPVHVGESLPAVSTHVQENSEEAPAKKKSKSKGKAKKDDALQNGDINWTETNGHETDQFSFLTAQLDKLNFEKDEIMRNYKDLSAENRLKETEINRLKTSVNNVKVQANQQITPLKSENTRLRQQLQNATIQNNSIPQMQEELDKRKAAIDSLRAQQSAFKTQNDAQLQQTQSTLDKKELERARILQDRDAMLEELNEANLTIAGLTTDLKKMERQTKEVPVNSASTPSAETDLRTQISSLQISLSASEKEAAQKQRLETELQQKQESIAQQQIAIDKLQDELSSRDSVSDDTSRVELESKVRDYEQKIEELSLQLEDWEESVSSLNSEMMKLRQESVPATELEDLQSDISEKENQIHRLTVLVENSQQEMDSIAEIMNEFQELKRKTDDLQTENDILQAKSSDSELDDSSVADLASKHAILKASIQQYEDMIVTHRDENEKMKQNLGEMEEKYQEKEEDNKVIRERLDSFKQKNNDLRESVWKMKDDVDVSRKSVEKESKSIQDNVKRFFSQVFPNLRAHGQDFEDWLGKMKGASTDYISRLEDDVKSATDALGESTTEAEQERDRVRDMLAKDKTQSEENEMLKNTIKDTEGEILLLQSQVEAEFARLKGDLSAEQKKALENETLIEEKNTELTDSFVQIESLNQETESLKNSVLPELKTTLKRRDTEIQELTDQMANLSQQKDQLENDLASTHRQSFDEIERTNSLQEENNSLFGMSEIIQGYKKDLADAKELINTLQSNQTTEPTVLENKLAQLQEENEILRQKNREMETHMETVPNMNNNNAVDSPKHKKAGAKSPKVQRQPSETTAL